MFPISSRLTALAAALVFILPIVGRAQEGLTVADFASQNHPGARSLSNPGSLRRGTTSTVRIIKNLIDLVPDAQISASDGATLGPVSHGRTSGGTGYIEMAVTIPSNQSVGSTVTINVGFVDHFAFSVVRKGQIGSVALSPNPTTILAGTQFTLTMTGTDFGQPDLSGLLCHIMANETFAGDHYSVRLTRHNSGTCAAAIGPFTYAVRSTFAGDPSVYATSSGGSSFSFGPYAVPPSPPPPCFSQPGIGAPTITSPVNHQRIVFFDGRTVASMLVRWDSLTQNNVAAPNNEWIATLFKQTGATATGFTQVTSRTLIGTSTTFVKLAVPGAYAVTIRAANCGQQAPLSSVEFTLVSDVP